MRSYNDANGPAPITSDVLTNGPARHAGQSGSEHTVAEISQQPELWRETAELCAAAACPRREQIQRNQAIVLTGSGSSHYVGECIAPALQRGSGLTTVSIGSGELLLAGRDLLAAQRPLLLVSFARSGNSPESHRLISTLLEQERAIEHLAVTCNPDGRVAEEWSSGSEPRVVVETLDARTCDKSLVMTSSFTNLALAGLGLAYLDRPNRYLLLAETLASVGQDLLGVWSNRLEPIARRQFARMIVLGSGGQFGAAREAALKMLEMTDGRVATFAESWLGFRHGPMCALQDDSLLLLFFSSDPAKRAYQVDLLKEVRGKALGGAVVAVGRGVPRELLSEGDLAIDSPGLAELPDEWAAIAQVVVGQLLGLFRCLEEGLQPDRPAPTGSISRVVPEFTLYPA